MRIRPRLALAFLLLVSLLLAALPLPVLGQGGTVLAVDPAQASVEVNGEREITLLVTDVDNLNAFDVQVEYDADRLSLSKWAFGDLLSNLAVVKRDDLPGSFRLVATQLATPGVSGDGILLKLTFKGKLEGSSAITITKAEFARSEGGLSLPELEHGSMTIIAAQPTATPTRTPTVTLVPTATATKAATATPTATRTATALPTATQVASATPAPTNTTGGAGQTTQIATATAGSTGALGPTGEPTSLPTQAEPAKATVEEGGIVAATTGQSNPPGSASGNGYFLQRNSQNSANTVLVFLFITGLFAIGAAAFIYTNRKKRV